MDDFVLLGLVAAAALLLGPIGFFVAIGHGRRIAELERAAGASLTTLEARIASLEAAEVGAKSAVNIPPPPLVRAPAFAPPPPIVEGPPPIVSAPAITAPEKAREAASAEVAEDATAPPGSARARSSSLEEALGARWTVWVGGVALALGALLLVRYSIEQGFFGPGLRVLLGLALGCALVGAGEAMRRRESAPARFAGVASADVPAALTAAGTVAAFGSVYAAHALYGFIGPGLAFVALGAIGVAAMAAAALHGPALAALGLVGSLAAPLLVASERPNAWPVAVYVGVVVAAAYWLARLRRWAVARALRRGGRGGVGARAAPRRVAGRAGLLSRRARRAGLADRAGRGGLRLRLAWRPGERQRASGWRRSARADRLCDRGRRRLLCRSSGRAFRRRLDLGARRRDRDFRRDRLRQGGGRRRERARRRLGARGDGGMAERRRGGSGVGAARGLAHDPMGGADATRPVCPRLDRRRPRRRRLGRQTSFRRRGSAPRARLGLRGDSRRDAARRSADRQCAPVRRRRVDADGGGGGDRRRASRRGLHSLSASPRRPGIAGDAARPWRLGRRDDRRARRRTGVRPRRGRAHRRPGVRRGGDRVCVEAARDWRAALGDSGARRRRRRPSRLGAPHRRGGAFADADLQLAAVRLWRAGAGVRRGRAVPSPWRRGYADAGLRRSGGSVRGVPDVFRNPPRDERRRPLRAGIGPRRTER